MPPKSEPGSPGGDRLAGVQPVRQKRPFTAIPLLSAWWQSMLGVGVLHPAFRAVAD